MEERYALRFLAVFLAAFLVVAFLVVAFFVAILFSLSGVKHRIAQLYIAYT